MSSENNQQFSNVTKGIWNTDLKYLRKMEEICNRKYDYQFYIEKCETNDKLHRLCWEKVSNLLTKN